MASIAKRGKYWRAQIRAKGYPAQYRTFDTRGQAEAWARLVESEMDRGCFIDRSEAERTSLGEALERYGREVSASKKSGPQELRRISILQRHPLSLRPLVSLRGVDFAEYRDQRRQQGKAPATIRLELSLLGHMFETARKEWGMEALQNPIRNIRKPPMTSGRERRLEPGEYEAIIDAIGRCSRTPWMRIAFELALGTALRRSMLVKLRWEWVDLNKRIIFVPASFRDTENKGVPLEIPLWPDLLAALRNAPRSIDGRIIPLTPNAITLAWRHIQLATSLQNLRWHDLRHEATSRLFERGLHPMEVASVTGHKSMQMLKRYTHIRAGDLLEKYGGKPATATEAR